MALDIDHSEDPQAIAPKTRTDQNPGAAGARTPEDAIKSARFDTPMGKAQHVDDAASAESGAPHNDHAAADFLREQSLMKMFPTQESAQQYAAAFLKMVDPKEQTLYTDTLLKYGETELDERKSLAVATRLEHFESSPEFKEASLKVKLSDFIKKEHAAVLSDAAREERKSATPGGAEAPNGLSRGEGNASVHAQNNLIKSAENLGAAGSNLAGSLSGLLTGVAKLAVLPITGPAAAATAFANKMKGDRIPRHEQIAQNEIDQGLQNLAKTVEKIYELPKDAAASKVQPLLEEAAQQNKDLNAKIRAQARQGANNALDENLTDKQKRAAKSPDEVLDSGESNSKKAAGLLDKLASAPALEGAGKEKLKEKAVAMAQEAAEMIRKMIDSIRNMFTQGNRAKAEGPAQAAPSAGQAPRM